MVNNPMGKQIYTVSRITTQIKTLLESNFPFVWIHGEISNFRVPVSGHYYFTLKDEDAQISAVMFRGQNRNLRFLPEEGMAVKGLGRISVYEPRGTYQIIFEYLEPEGTGALQKAFEQLKAKLEAEGLFDNRHKSPIPFLPGRISIITSPTGAVVHDIIDIVGRRFPGIPIDIIPVKVQGDGAEQQIVSAIRLMNRLGRSDVAIIARGGGSLEDFHAFNSETTARAVFESQIPIISAIGHETDFTITDFVADLRAPTPSAAAELAVPDKRALLARCQELDMLLATRFSRYVESCRLRLFEIRRRLVDPRRRIADFRLKIDDLSARLVRHMIYKIRQDRERLNWRTRRHFSLNPHKRVKSERENVDNYLNCLNWAFRKYLDKKYALVREMTAEIQGLDPYAVLNRGYSITRRVDNASIVTGIDQVQNGEDVEIILAKGILLCRVKGKRLNEKSNF